jgi:hypothetical protein
METLLEKPEVMTEDAVLEKEFGELFERTLRLEYELEAVVSLRSE